MTQSHAALKSSSWLSHDPSRRNLTEGQVDHASRNAIFTYGELGPGLCLAAQDRQPDRPERGGDGGAAEPPDLLLAEPQRCTRLCRGAQPQPAQVAVGAALVMEAGGRLPARVAALCEADRGRDDPRPRRPRLG